MRNLRLLLVDGSRPFPDIATKFLDQLEGVQVIGCERAVADAMVKAGQLSPDLVLVDSDLSEMNGLLVTLALKTLPGSPRVILITDVDDPMYLRLAAAVQVDGLVSREGFAREVAAEIRRLFPEPENLQIEA
jgi:DNA-binding NarL/FixJ family response regulator